MFSLDRNVCLPCSHFCLVPCALVQRTVMITKVDPDYLPSDLELSKLISVCETYVLFFTINYAQNVCVLAHFKYPHLK